jgi:hypothetical protein
MMIIWLRMSLSFVHIGLDEDARAGSILATSMEHQFSTDIVDLERTHQMWTFICSRYETT